MVPSRPVAAFECKDGRFRTIIFDNDSEYESLENRVPLCVVYGDTVEECLDIAQVVSGALDTWHNGYGSYSVSEYLQGRRK